MRYGDYLNLDRLLGAQEPPGDDGKPRALAHHDEMLFVVVHQVFELWFKQTLHELTRARDLLAVDEVPETDIPRIVAALLRIHEIQRLCVHQFDVLETLQPLRFLSFRDRLGSASGFQSSQFRELEALSGLQPAQDGRPNFKQAVYAWLARTPVEEGFAQRYLAAFETYVERQRGLQQQNPDLDAKGQAAVQARLDAYLASCHEFLAGESATLNTACLFLTAYSGEPLLHLPCSLVEAVTAFDEWFRIWRFRHARMVERIIGPRVGTGGSSGVDYLDSTVRASIFPELLHSRAFLVPADLLPPLSDPDRYGFAKDLQG